MENLLFLGILFVPIVLISFLVTLFVLPRWIKKAKVIGLVWRDMHKKGKPKNVAGSGGIAAVLGFSIGVLVYIAVKTFLFNSSENLIEILALLVTIFIVLVIGFIDDIFGWQRGGLSIRTRLVMLVFAAIPLMVINAGQSAVLGIDFGIFFPLIIVPIAIVGATSTFNFLAGYNGLEASQGILLLTGLSLAAFLTGSLWLALMGGCMIASLGAFYIFNKYPAKVFAGDSLTYAVGALVAGIAILGNIEKIALFFFIPYIIEFFLKVRGKLKKQSFSKLNADESLDSLYGKIYGLEHLAVAFLKKIKISHKAYEWEVPMIINLFQILIIFIGFIIFF